MARLRTIACVIACGWIGCVADTQRENLMIAACGEACGKVELGQSTPRESIPCLESISITTHAGGSDVVCRCSCSRDGGTAAKEVWR